MKVSKMRKHFKILIAMSLSQMLVFENLVQAEVKHAQETHSPPIKIIMLKDVIQEALNNNPALRVAKFEALSKGAEIGPKGSYDDPMLGYEAMNYPVDTLSPYEFSMTGNQFSLSQKIPFPGKLSKLRNAATHEYNSKKENFNNEQLLLIKTVRIAYYELFLAYKKQAVVNEELTVTHQLISVTRQRYTVGKVSNAELLNFQLEEATLNQQLFEAEKLIDQKMGDLNHALGRSNHHEMGKPEEIKKTQVNFSKVTEGYLEDKITSLNPSLKSKHFNVDAAEERLSHAKWNYLPDFEFLVAYTKRKPSPGDRGVDFISGGVALSIPLWAFSKQSEEVNGASADKAKAEAQFEEERLHILHMVHSMYAELNEARKNLDLFGGGLLPLAQQSITSGRSAYLSGKIEYASLLNLVKTRFQTEYAYYQALVKYESMIAELEALTGGPFEGS